MKILLITMEWPPFKGGVGNYYFNLAKELAGQGIEMVVLTRVLSAQSLEGIKIITVPFFYNFFWPRWLKLYFTAKKVIKNENPDLIWVGQVLPIGEVAYLIKKSLNIPYFVSTHGMDILLPQKNLRQDKILKKILQNANFITANSQFTKKELLNLGLADDKVEIIYPCPHIKNNQIIKEPEPAPSEAEGNHKILLTVGRLVKRKGQAKVIAIMPQLLQNFPNLSYLIVGNGPEKNNLQTQIKTLKLQDSVKIFTDVADEKLAEYYHMADIFIMPVENLNGDAEGFGIVYLEASSFGLPVIGGNSGGVTEAVIENQTGLLVEPGNQQDLIAKISLLLTNENLRKQLGQAGQARVATEFKWPHQANKLIAKIQKIILK